jgi:hypothetical protein
MSLLGHFAETASPVSTLNSVKNQPYTFEKPPFLYATTFSKKCDDDNVVMIK